MTENEIGTIIVETAIEIHKELGPGLLESVYETVLVHELRRKGLKAEPQVSVSIRYKDLTFDKGFRADVIVEEKVIVELKSVQQICASDKKQAQTYLKLTDMKLGYVLNFGEALMKDGITRCVNGLKEKIEREPLPKDFFKS